MTKFYISLGNNCTKACAHCVSRSFPKNHSEDLTLQEYENLVNTIKHHQPPEISFIGGEPTLYLNKISNLIDDVSKKYSPNISITTNGWFAQGSGLPKNYLGRIKNLKGVILSIDRFHSPEIDLALILKIQRYCIDHDISFSVSAVLSEPKEIIDFSRLVTDHKIQVVYQKVVTVGRALDKNIKYPRTDFDKKVLKKKCPGSEVVTYLPNKGFSRCCANLVFGPNYQKYSFNTLEELNKSKVYNIIKENTFGEIANLFGVNESDFLPHHSDPCHLCEFLFEKVNSLEGSLEFSI